MRYSFIFCLLAMYYTASANATYCWNIVPCPQLCETPDGGQDFTTNRPGTSCTTHGRKPGTCQNGECKQN
uniref:Putative salivary kunitz domain protein n=1 Tax=Ixodes ricinus TaxID=34613 RepID=A0A0K8R757_IXORI